MMVACAVELSAHFGKEALEPLVELGRKSTGFWFMMLLMCVHGVNAKSLKEHTCNETTLTLGWILMFGFCLQCLQWLLNCMLHTCKHFCDFCWKHRPNLSHVLVAVWFYCSFVTVAIAIPDAHASLLALVFCSMRIAANTLLHVLPLFVNRFWLSCLCIAFLGEICSSVVRARLFTPKTKIILQCRYVHKTRCKQHRYIWRSRQRCQKRQPVQCMRIATANLPRTKVHQGVDVDWNALRGGAGAASAATKPKSSERELLEGLKSLLQNFHDDDEPTSQPSQPIQAQPQTLLGALQQLVAHAESHPENLLSRLKQLVSDACEGKLASQPAGSKTPASSRHTTYRQQNANIPRCETSRTWAQVAATPMTRVQLQTTSRNPSAAKSAKSQKEKTNSKLWVDPNDKGSVITVHALRQMLEKGEAPTAKLCSANFQTATELRTLAKAHGIDKTSQTAIVVMYGEAPSETQQRWVHVQSRGSGPEMKKFPIVPLGESLPALPTCSAKKVDIPKGDQDIMCFRINLPFCFSEYSWKQCQVKPANIISGLLRDNGLQDGLIGTYGWRTLESQQWSDYAEAVTGFLKIDPKNAESVLKLSGSHGVFFEPLAKNRTSTVINWIAQNKDESDDEYMARVRAMDHTNGLTYRRQGKSRLGLRNPEGSYQPPENRARVWEAQGISPRWSTGTISKWLNTNGWTEVELLAQPSRNRGWLFRAKNSATSFCFAFENDAGDYITISQFFHQKKKPFQKPIRAAGSSLNQSSLWTSLNGAKGAAPPARRTHEEIAPTLADTPTQVGMEVEGADAPAESNSQTETGDVRMTEAKRSSLQGKAEGETPEKKRANKQKEKSHSSLSEFENFEFCDLGGEGDCAYRSLAVAYALQDSRDVKESISASQKLGATLRAQVSSHIQKHEHFKRDFKPDPRWSEKLEDGPIPATYEQWVSATARPNRWIDGPCLSTAATRLSRNIAIWKWQGEPGHESWVKQIVIPPIPGHARNIQQANSFPPLPLFLRNGHYVTIKPGDNPFPMHWHENPAHTSWDAGDNRGGAKSYSSWLPPSSPSSVKKDGKKKARKSPHAAAGSCASWLPPSSASSVKYALDPKDGKTTQRRAISYRSWLPASSPASLKQVDKQFQPKPDEPKSSSAKKRIPVSSISRSAKGAASSSAHSTPAPKRRCAGPDPPKNGSKPFAFERGTRKLGRPPKGDKTKKFDRKTAIKMFHQSHLVWVCPECQTRFEGKYGSVISSKRHHWRTRHPDKPTDLILRPKINTYEVSHELPQDQQAWSCPLCTAALPSLPDQDRKRAIKKHCQDCHPDHSLQDLANLNKWGRKNPKNARRQREKWVKFRKQRFKTHDPVDVAIPERQQKNRGTKAETISFNVYCRKCLTWLNSKNGISPSVTCAKRQKLFRENKSSQLQRRNWWIRIKKDEPQHAKNYAAAMGKSFEELDEFYQVTA